MSKSWVKGGLTVLGAVFFSTLGIFAADTFRGLDTGISNMAGVGGSSLCKRGSVPMNTSGRTICVDIYEASPSSGCPHSQPLNTLESERNINTSGCISVSQPNVKPWTFISLPQAQRMCAASGKRLPTSEEWYRIALGTNASDCVVSQNSVAGAGNGACVSGIGVHDAIGNVWEWVDATVIHNTFDGRTLPETGYVTSVDAQGLAITSDENPDELYGNDYFWSKEDGVFGMIRGGFYGSYSDAGLYATNAAVATSFASQGVGFRCVEDVF